jgi:hypothetical protein
MGCDKITLDWGTCKLYMNKAKIKLLKSEVEFLRKFTCGDVYLNDVEERYQAQKKRLEKLKKVV